MVELSEGEAIRVLHMCDVYVGGAPDLPHPGYLEAMERIREQVPCDAYMEWARGEAEPLQPPAPTPTA